MLAQATSSFESLAMTRYIVCVLLACGLLAATASAAHDRKLLQRPMAEVLTTVQDFCKSPDIKNMKCNWDRNNKGDKSSASSDTCHLCGTIWGNWIEEIPQTFEPMRGGAFFRSPPGFVSLACRPGRLVVRAVYKILKTPPGGSFQATTMLNSGDLGTQGSNATPVRRCELSVAGFTPGPVTGPTPKSEVDAALKQAKEVNCKEVGSFPDFKEGGWYSDTFHMDWSGCEGVLKAGTKNYEPARPWITSNPGRPGFLLAKFEVQEA